MIILRKLFSKNKKDENNKKKEDIQRLVSSQTLALTGGFIASDAASGLFDNLIARKKAEADNGIPKAIKKLKEKKKALKNATNEVDKERLVNEIKKESQFIKRVRKEISSNPRIKRNRRANLALGLAGTAAFGVGLHKRNKAIKRLEEE